jgi:hypothetical protein
MCNNVLTAFIALIVAFISALQWITARQKVVLDLFDKRFAVYEELREAITPHLGRMSTVEDMGKFNRAANRAQFLFGPEVTSFLDERLVDLSVLVVEDNKEEKTPIPPEDGDQTAEQNEYVIHLGRVTRFFKDFDALVAPYMKHTQKRFPIPYIDA